MLNRETTGIEPDDDNRDEATTSHHDVEEVPSVGTVAAPPQTIQTNENIDQVNDSDAQEEVGYVARQKQVVDGTTVKLTAKIIKEMLRSEGLGPMRLSGFGELLEVEIRTSER